MSNVQLIAAIAAGGSVGAVLRFLLSGWVMERFPSVIPLGTLLVNATGALLVGFLYVVITEKLLLPATWRPLLITGFLGALTTFSAFSLELVELLTGGQVLAALIYLLASVILCVLLAWLGMGLGRLF